MIEQNTLIKKVGGIFDLGAIPHSNLDASYGPYTTISEANLLIPEESRGIGLTVGILKFSSDNNGEYVYDDNMFDEFEQKYYETYYKKDNFEEEETRYSISGVQEYWFQPTSEGTLELETKRIETKLINIDFTVTYNQSNNSVIVQYNNIQGNSIFSQNSVSIYRNNTLQATSTFNSEGESFVFNNVPIGKYTYKIQIVDIFGQSLIKTCDITVGIVKINKTNFNISRLSKITSDTIEGQNFGLEIDILNENWKNADFGIYADEDKIINISNDHESERLTSNITINSEIANQMDGHIIYIKCKLDELNEYQEELFRVLGSNVLYVTVLNEYIPKFYVKYTTYLNLEFKSGANSLEISPGSGSDFSFKNQTINFNKNGVANINLYITPESETENSQLVFSYGDNRTTSLSLGNILETPQSERSVNWESKINEINNLNLDSVYLDFSGTLVPNRETNADKKNGSNIIVEFNNKMYITNDVIHVNDIEIATPLNEKIYVGLGFGLKDINPNIPIESGDPNIVYDCICINGTIVKISENTRTGGYLNDWNINSIFNNEYLNIDNVAGTPCTGLYVNDVSLFKSNDNTEIPPICESNYKEDFDSSSNEDDKIIPTMYLEVIENAQPGEYAVWKDGFHNVSFGNISDGSKKYGTPEVGGPPSDDSKFKLLKISESYKSDYQKYYGVVCRYYYTEGNNPLPSNISEITPENGWETGIVTVYTQGTSTLGYAIPNFKLYFKSGNSFILKYSSTQNITENILTAKADYMESSHLNNTPTAMLYNNIVKDEDIITKESESPSIKENYNDAIVGIPIRLMIKDRNTNSYSNYGSFMLNTDKVSYTLGFKVNDLGENPIPTCISFEGKSNAIDSGLASRFIIDDSTSKIFTDINLSQAFTDINSLIENNMNPKTWYCDNTDDKDININKKGVIKYKDDGNGTITFKQNLKTNSYKKVLKVLEYLSQGFEYRYPDDADIIKSKKIKDDQYDEYNIMPFDHFKAFFKMFYKVATSINSTNIDDMFNLDYCYLYIIFMIVFGQSDNLGKNCMFDCWKEDGTWGKWYPRPYDLDSQSGLNNGGVECIPPFVQVNRNWVPSNLQEREYDEIFNSRFRYKYMPSTNIFAYSSSTSKLWENIYLRHTDSINDMYSLLRVNNKHLSYEKLINHFKTIIIDKIPIHQYNIDFKNKYLGSPQQSFMLGNRWTNFKDWIKARLAFCDGFFKYKNASYWFIETKNFNVNYIFPAYLTKIYGNDSQSLFGTNIQTIIGDAGNQVYKIYLSDSLVSSTNLYSDVSCQTSQYDIFEFSNMEELTLGAFSVSPDLSKCNVLSKLVITNTCTLPTIDVPNSVQTLICNSSNITKLNFSEGSELKTIQLIGNISDKTSEIIPIQFNSLDLSKCLKLQSLTIDKCEIRGNFKLPAGKYSFSSTNCTFNDVTSDENTIIDDLDLSNQSIGSLNLRGTIKRLDLFNTLLTNTILDLTNVQQIDTLNLIKCNVTEVKTENNTFNSDGLRLGVQDSHIIKLYNVNQSYDGIDLTVLPDNVTSIINCNENTTSKHPISGIYSLRYFNNEYQGKTEASEEWKNIEKSSLSFGKTPITKVKVKKNETEGTCLFSQCKQLQTIEKESGNDSILNSNWIFYDCTNLTTINSHIKIGKFKGAFMGTTIPYNKAESMIYTNSNNGDFRYFYSQVQSNNLTININPSNYPKITRLDSMFSQNYYSGYFTYTQGIQRKQYNITINNGDFWVVDGVTTLSGLFFNCGNINIPVEFIKKNKGTDENPNYVSALEDITDSSLVFTKCNVESINVFSLLNQLVNINNCRALFYESIIRNTIDNYELELVNTKLTTLCGMFMGAKFGETVDENFVYHNIKIDNFIKNLNSANIDLQACFYNSNSYIDNDFIINDNTNNVTINGFLGCSSYTNANIPITKVVYNNKFVLKQYGENIIVGISTISENNNNYESVLSPFGNRVISNETITINNESTSPNLNYYLFGIHKTSNSIVTNVNITNSSNISGICKNAYNININFSTNYECAARKAFENCNFNESCRNNIHTQINLNNITDAFAMFAGSNINAINFNLPSSITNVKSMFNQCFLLRNGLPKNFFDFAINISDVSKMFYKTKIVSTNEIDSLNKMNPIVLPNNIERADDTFTLVDIDSGETAYSIQIGGNKLQYATGICAAMNNNINISMSGLISQIEMPYAFVNRTGSINNFSTQCMYIGSAIGMFYRTEPTEDQAENIFDISNMPSTTDKTGIFYNWAGHTNEIMNPLPTRYTNIWHVSNNYDSTYLE